MNGHPKHAISRSAQSRWFQIRLILLNVVLHVIKGFRKRLQSLRLFALRRPRNVVVMCLFLGLIVALVGFAAICLGHRVFFVFRRVFRRHRHTNGAVRSEADREHIVSLGEDDWKVGEVLGVASRVGHVEYMAPQDDEVRIAYFIQIGADSIPLLPRLFARLHHPDNVYVVHVDSKVPENDQVLVEDLIRQNDAYRQNMHMMPSEMLTYKGISMVLNTIGAMTLAHNVDKKWDYFINLSGADYPLLSARSQRRLLARPRIRNGPLNFMSLFPEKEWQLYSFRVRSQYWDPAIVGYQDPSARLRRMKGMLFNPLEAYRRFAFVKAEAWVILSRSFCEFIIRSSYAKRMLLNHVHMLSAPEHYFVDVLHNHPVWRKTLVPDAFRKVVWHHQRRRSGQHPYALDKGSHIFSFWLYLEKTRSIFARKMSKPDSALLDRIDRELSGALPLADKQGREIGYSDYNNSFYARFAAHFDSITQETLRLQNVQWPEYAYPQL